MLPKQVIDLTDRFVRVFDSERPAAVEFRRAGDQASASYSQAGPASDGSAIIAVGKNITAYVDDRTRFIWKKLREAVALTELEAYTELSSDLKLQIATYFDPVRLDVERYMEELRRSAEAPPGCVSATRSALAGILSTINAEVDSFCAKCTSNRNKEIQLAAAQAFSIGNVHRLAGYAIRSRTKLSRCSARQILVDHTIPRQSKRRKPLLAVFSCLMLGIGVYLAYLVRKHS
jgi:hypothetical protein